MVEVKKKKGETFDSLLRRFQRRMQQGGIALEARKQRFHEHEPNRNKSRESALRRETKRQQYEYLLKTGQLKEEAPRRPPRS
ncbi:MAG: 30S ribosomal protein S21 [Patescibacteria group bacterium]|jgi:small subunit ribosomal protein S21|nr:30S ribosomal protein S21 [Patescibacteria group bacterium]